MNLWSSRTPGFWFSWSSAQSVTSLFSSSSPQDDDDLHADDKRRENQISCTPAERKHTRGQPHAHSSFTGGGEEAELLGVALERFSMAMCWCLNPELWLSARRFTNLYFSFLILSCLLHATLLWTAIEINTKNLFKIKSLKRNITFNLLFNFFFLVNV